MYGKLWIYSNIHEKYRKVRIYTRTHVKYENLDPHTEISHRKLGAQIPVQKINIRTDIQILIENPIRIYIGIYTEFLQKFMQERMDT